MLEARHLRIDGDGAAVRLSCKSAITQARVRLGEAPLCELFRRVARLLAEPGAPVYSPSQAGNAVPGRLRLWL
jgi:hypothetical protein